MSQSPNWIRAHLLMKEERLGAEGEKKVCPKSQVAHYPLIQFFILRWCCITCYQHHKNNSRGTDVDSSEGYDFQLCPTCRWHPNMITNTVMALSLYGLCPRFWQYQGPSAVLSCLKRINNSLQKRFLYRWIGWWGFFWVYVNICAVSIWV